MQIYYIYDQLESFEIKVGNGHTQHKYNFSQPEHHKFLQKIVTRPWLKILFLIFWVSVTTMKFKPYSSVPF